MKDAQTGPRIEVAVEVAGIDAELAADLLRQACPGGVAIEAASCLDENIDAYVLDGDAPAIVKGYIAAGDDAGASNETFASPSRPRRYNGRPSGVTQQCS